MVILRVLLSFPLIFQFVLPAIAFSEAGEPAAAQVQTYDQLVRAIRQAKAASQKRTEEAVAQEKVREAWEIGKLIQEHILLNQERADYGKQVLKRLSADLGISVTEIQYMLEFYRAYPIYRTSGKLTWGHYESLLRINDSQKREALAERAEKENWTIKKTRHEIKRLKNRDPKALTAVSLEAPLVPIKGKLNTYRIVTAPTGKWKGQPVLDLGFSNYLNHPSLKSGRFKEGDIVTVVGADLRVRPRSISEPGDHTGSPLHLLKDATPADLFTYRAYPFNITDGDTLWVWVDLGFGVVTQQHLRLRGIDAPEIESAEGREAKRFVERELKNASSLIITSSKSDKYDRYLADVFYPAKTGVAFLNDRLLEAGLAYRDNG